MKNITKEWKDEQEARYRAMSNRELWEEFLWAQIPDDYDGCFTAEGQWMANRTRAIMEQRLAPCLQDTEPHAPTT